MKILIVEDDLPLAEMVKAGLMNDSHTADIAENGNDGAFMARSFEYDAIILDYTLPHKNGVIICREIRASGKKVPIIFLSATDDVEVKVDALNSGADDYITKPFSMQELCARIRALSRRPSDIREMNLVVHDLVLDAGRQMVMRNGAQIRLTRKEFNLLEYLMRHKGTLIGRTALVEHVWSSDSDPFSNTVEAHVRNLRAKINTNGNPNLIANVPGRGYMIDTPENIAMIRG